MLATVGLSVAGEISEETLDRFSVEGPSAAGWQAASADAFPWHPKAFVRGWTREAGGALAGIFWAFSTPSYPVPVDSLYVRLAGPLAEDYGAVSEGSHATDIAGYQAASMTFHADQGSGLFFDGGEWATTIRFVYFQLEQHRDSKTWPLALFFCAAPRGAFADVEKVFEAIVASVSVAPAGAGPATSLEPAVARPTQLQKTLPSTRKPAGQTMSYADYRDSERRLVPAMLIPSLIWPGALHMMADDGRTGWINAGVGVGGVGLLAVGISDDNQILGAVGASLYLGGLIYDWVHGATVIEEKRTRARFKYGK